MTANAEFVESERQRVSDEREALRDQHALYGPAVVGEPKPETVLRLFASELENFLRDWGQYPEMQRRLKAFEVEVWFAIACARSDAKGLEARSL